MGTIIYLKVALYSEHDLTEDEIQDVVAEVDYNFDHYLIKETKIQEIL